MRPKGKSKSMRRTVLAGLCGAALAGAVLTAPAQARTGGQEHPFAGGLSWQLKESGSDARFRGLAAVSRDTAWVAGAKGTVLR
ncbi:oxidoreductase, partial [Streptomyces alfalfae]